MVKINGKEYTEEQLENMMGDLKISQETLKKTNKKLKDIDDINEKLQAMKTLEAENKELKAEKLQALVSDRKNQISKYLEGKDLTRQTAILDRLADMDSDEWDDFKDGKTNEDLITKDELLNSKEALESKEQDFNKRREEIIKEEAAKLKSKAIEGDLLPTDAVDISNDDVDTDLIGGQFPNIDKLKELYKLKTNNIWKSKSNPDLEEQAISYLEINYDREEV